jgi:hypothetical protein
MVELRLSTLRKLVPYDKFRKIIHTLEEETLGGMRLQIFENLDVAYFRLFPLLFAGTGLQAPVQL